MSSKKSKVGFDSLEIGTLGERYELPDSCGKLGQILVLSDGNKLSWRTPPNPTEYSASGKRTYHGRCQFINGDTTVHGLKFPSLGHTGYTISVNIRHETEKSTRRPAFYTILITKKTDSSFQILTDKPVNIKPGEKYWLEWMVVED